VFDVRIQRRQQERLVLWVVDGLVEVGAGKGAYRIPRFPARDEDELRALAHDPTEDIDPAVTRRSEALRDAGTLQVLEILVRFRGRGRPLPHSCDHGSLPSSRFLVRRR